jgi:hypothetical protein
MQKERARGLTWMNKDTQDSDPDLILCFLSIHVKILSSRSHAPRAIAYSKSKMKSTWIKRIGKIKFNSLPSSSMFIDSCFHGDETKTRITAGWHPQTCNVGVLLGLKVNRSEI